MVGGFRGDFKLIRETAADVFEEEVNQAIENGYEPVGGVILSEGIFMLGMWIDRRKRPQQW